MTDIAQANGLTRPAAWLGFLAMCLGMFMAILDIQIVASSLPEIQRALDIPNDSLSWVQTAYLIAEIVAIPLTGRLTRLLTLGGLFAAAVTGFSLASLGCALSGGYASLILCRVIQGFCGGAVIPTIFTAVFVLFPERAQVLATTIAGIFAVLAPTLGPAVGGYITETFSWHWLFLINLAPGVAVVAIVGKLVRVGRPDWSLLKRLDYASVAFAAVFLASLEILLKEGPKREWHGLFVTALVAVLLVSGFAAVRQCLKSRAPLVDLRAFLNRTFTVGCAYSFVLGIGLYGSVYLLPLFLGYVRHHTPLEIGEIMIVGGVAQLMVAPVAALAEKRYHPILVTGVGYALFAAGLFGNGFTAGDTDFSGLFWPQVLRGAGLMLCILPTATMALEGRAGDVLADASALFNLMRNLGGAIGIALVDTILEQRPAAHAATLVERLQAGDVATARFVGLPPLISFGRMTGAAAKKFAAPYVEQAALVLSFNEAWLLLGAIFALSLLILPLGRRHAARAR
ncbi:MAG: DHA2 family efflux MFS transporter permease subunit [Alphaproteobacteria bacterium]